MVNTSTISVYYTLSHDRLQATHTPNLVSHAESEVSCGNA